MTAAPPPPVLVLVGPTASGKTAVSLPLADMLGGEIVSADSRQVYRGLDIGTAKPDAAARARVPHHFIDIRDPDEVYTAGTFGNEARLCVAEILRRGRAPVVVGGSGLYLRSLVDGLFEGPGADPEIRDRLERRMEEVGAAGLLEELRAVDPDTAAAIDPTKPRRIVRALEVWHATGMPLSMLQRERKPEIPFVPVFAGLAWDRAELNRRIDERCDTMVAAGLLDEVRGLREQGYSPGMNALNTVGYVEAFAHLEGKITAGEMLERIKTNTRRYAKRQGTWFRADGRIRWLAMDRGRVPDAVAAEVAEFFLRSGGKKARSG